MKTAQGRVGGVVLGLILVMVTGCAAGTFTKDETPGQRFDREMKVFAENCAKAKLKPNDTACDILKLKPADPLATEEGRFVHAIKIPNPVPTDSGYKPGMTPDQYFEHLCKTEAGEFIYKTIDNVESIYFMRPREFVREGANHLYAYEDPYGGLTEGIEPEIWFVRPSRYFFIETTHIPFNDPDWRKKRQFDPTTHTVPDKDMKYVRLFGYDGRDKETMQKTYGTSLQSRYGYTWRGIVRPHDRELGIAGGEAIILDLRTQEVLGVHRGYAKFEIDEKVGLARAYWLKQCPPPPHSMGGGAHLNFILKVLKPTDKPSDK